MVEVCRPIFDNLNGNDLLGLQVLAFDDLTECSLPKNVEDEISVPNQPLAPDSIAFENSQIVVLLVICFFTPKNIVNIKNIIAIIIIVSVIFRAFTRLRQYPARVTGRLVFKTGVAYSVGGRKMCGKSL